MPDLMAGITQMGFDTLPAVQANIDSGQLKLLAAGGPDRSPQYPDVPTVAEAGIPDFAANSWGMVLAPKGTPDDVIGLLNAQIGNVLQMQEVKDKFATMGAIVVADTPADSKKFLQSQVALYGDLVERLGIEAAN